MGVAERREREKAGVRSKIMDAARDLFASEGYEAVSMRRIAEAIEYSPTAIYVHFQDKSTLFREICSRDFQALAHVFHDVAQISDPLDRIRAIGRTYIEYGLRHPNHYRLMFMTPQTAACATDLGPAEKARIGNPAEDAYAFLRLCVADAMKAGKLRPQFQDAELVSQTLWACVHGVVSLEITMGTDPWINWKSVAERANAVLEATLVGIARVDSDKHEAPVVPSPGVPGEGGR